MINRVYLNYNTKNVLAVAIIIIVIVFLFFFSELFTYMNFFRGSISRDVVYYCVYLKQKIHILDFLFF